MIVLCICHGYCLVFWTEKTWALPLAHQVCVGVEKDKSFCLHHAGKKVWTHTLHIYVYSLHSYRSHSSEQVLTAYAHRKPQERKTGCIHRRFSPRWGLNHWPELFLAPFPLWCLAHTVGSGKEKRKNWCNSTLEKEKHGVETIFTIVGVRHYLYISQIITCQIQN